MNLSFRKATAEDLPLLIKMLADDRLGKQREDSSIPPNKAYIQAFKQIDSDQNNHLIVAQSKQQIVGMLQLTFIPYLTHTGSWRCLIEGVRIDRNHRGKGLGKQLIQWAIKQAREKDCTIVQLSSDKQRPAAINFYERLGFKASHEGFKLILRTVVNE